MSYPVKFNPDRYKEIEGILQDLQDLDPGSRMTLRGLDRDSLIRIRTLIYEWLYHMEMKTRFNLKVLSGDLVILRRGIPKNLTVDIDSPSLEVALDTHLKQALREADGVEYIRNLHKEKKIDLEEFGKILAEYGRIMK